MAKQLRLETEETRDTPQVHIVDDDKLWLDAVVSMVESGGFCAVPHVNVGEFMSGLRPNEYSCILLELRMPDVQGMSLMRELYANHRGIPVVMMSDDPTINSAIEALRCGALDLLVKPLRRQALLNRVIAALEVARVGRRRRQRVEEILQMVERLTPRETEVMHLLRAGLTVKQIAYDLGLSHKTVHVHRSRVLDQMRVDSPVCLANLIHDLESLQSPTQFTALAGSTA